LPNGVIASAANYFTPMKIKKTILTFSTGLMVPIVNATTYTTYGIKTVNSVEYNLSPYAHLFGANLSYGELTNANLSYANLSYGNLSYAFLTESNLIGAEMSHANLSYTFLSKANLSGNDLTQTKSSYAFLSEANLSDTDFSNADLSYANLDGANLTNINLTGTDLSYACLSHATVSYLNWTDFSTNSGATGLNLYTYEKNLLIYAGPAPTVPEPSTYGLIGISALAVAFAARRRKLKSA